MSAVALFGRGLFSGQPQRVALFAGERGAGWRLGRSRRGARPIAPDAAEGLPHRSRVLGIELMEHLQAALLLCGVDDVDIVVPGGEVPLLDGSAWPFVRALRQAGMAREVEGRLEIGIRLEGASLGWCVDDGAGIAKARTFVSAGDARRLLVDGVFRGPQRGAVVFSAGTALFGGRPRMAGEPLAHKLLDLIGDLGPWRARGRVVGTLEVEAPSHRRNRDAIEAAFTAGTLRWA